MPPSLGDEKELLLAAEQGEGGSMMPMPVSPKPKTYKPSKIGQAVTALALLGLGITGTLYFLSSAIDAYNAHLPYESAREPPQASEPVTLMQQRCIDICRNDFNNYIVEDQIEIFVAEVHPYTIQHSQQQKQLHKKKRSFEPDTEVDETEVGNADHIPDAPIPDQEYYAHRRSQIHQLAEESSYHLIHRLTWILHASGNIPEKPEQWQGWYDDSVRTLDWTLNQLHIKYEAQLRLATLDMYDTIRNTYEGAGPGYENQVIPLPMAWLGHLAGQSDTFKDANGDFLSDKNFRIAEETARLIREIKDEEGGIDLMAQWSRLRTMPVPQPQSAPKVEASRLGEGGQITLMEPDPWRKAQAEFMTRTFPKGLTIVDVYPPYIRGGKAWTEPDKWTDGMSDSDSEGDIIAKRDLDSGSGVGGGENPIPAALKENILAGVPREDHYLLEKQLGKAQNQKIEPTPSKTVYPSTHAGHSQRPVSDLEEARVINANPGPVIPTSFPPVDKRSPSPTSYQIKTLQTRFHGNPQSSTPTLQPRSALDSLNSESPPNKPPKGFRRRPGKALPQNTDPYKHPYRGYREHLPDAKADMLIKDPKKPDYITNPLPAGHGKPVASAGWGGTVRLRPTPAAGV
ncbi:hypothetical protein QBC44DRAFT_394025 [Cladorrhinum sp. PSN332]|nr:hypothetical protein QBC44DRAFT_394025 [Cladorrhinum sp. PSN332]